jgi:hypothetical protein
VKHSATLQGEGLKYNVIINSTTQSGQVIDLWGAEVKEVRMDTKRAVEIMGAENVKKWMDSKGKKIKTAV